MQTATAIDNEKLVTQALTANDEISAIDAARQLQIDLNRLYVLLRLGRIAGRKVEGEWRVSTRSVADRIANR